ncbi:hypothetical protein B0F90DRAFT_1708970 [Multifurca ochricompacta]|uniref:Uncharacterized protein n=1 Tax=Multifurca ochricompacta TaxID=376703 RepID=A0AAD4QNN7_9AGAM|nr:hypothetical protein B0F90DRAFT_1708970 [Multifurca ochricompacta]
MTTVVIRSIFRNGAHSLARPTVNTTATTSKRASRAYSTSSVHDNDPEVLEREKRRNLTRQPYQTSSPLDHSPGWNEHLATTSEANIKADQDASSSHDLASRTVAHIKAKDSLEENHLASPNASYDRDEVSGPLRSAPGTTGVVDIDDSYEEEIKEQEGAWTHKVRREHIERSKSRLP